MVMNAFVIQASKRVKLTKISARVSQIIRFILLPPVQFCLKDTFHYCIDTNSQFDWLVSGPSKAVIDLRFSNHKIFSCFERQTCHKSVRQELSLVLIQVRITNSLLKIY